MECGWTTNVPLNVLCVDLQVITNGNAHQLLYVLVDIQHDLILPHGMGEGSDGRDLVCLHYYIQTLE